jgi:hypothetical protein
LFVVLLIQAPPSQELEPPANPARFKAKSVVLIGEGYQRCEEAYHRLFARRSDQAATGN